MYGNTEGQDQEKAHCSCTHNASIRFEEISEADARELATGDLLPVYGIPADPIEIDHFDKNGFQAWSKQGYRFEALRYFKVREPRS
jgi:hypothetical protein